MLQSCYICYQDYVLSHSPFDFYHNSDRLPLPLAIMSVRQNIDYLSYLGSTQYNQLESISHQWNLIQNSYSIWCFKIWSGLVFSPFLSATGPQPDFLFTKNVRTTTKPTWTSCSTPRRCNWTGCNQFFTKTDHIPTQCEIWQFQHAKQDLLFCAFPVPPWFVQNRGSWSSCSSATSLQPVFHFSQSSCNYNYNYNWTNPQPVKRVISLYCWPLDGLS